MECPKCHSDNPSDTRFCGQCGAPFEMADIPTVTIQTNSRRITRGSLLAGRYEIIEEIGRGGMGWVYKVYDQRIDEKIAIKLINPAVAQDPTVIERFKNELKIARRIIHKNVCRMYELTEAEGRQFITMEFIQGEDLKSLITRIGQMTFRKTIAISRQICDGLAEAHAIGIVHRDLKPQNIMIDLKGNVRITDFGIAQSVHSRGLTKTGMIIGTPEYMSPEQVDGITVDQRSDVYSLGIILYQMLTGNVPFEGQTPLSLAMKHKTESPIAPRTINGFIPEPLDNLILKCLEKDPSKRYQTVQALNGDLALIEKDLPSTESGGREMPTKTKAGTAQTGKKAKWWLPLLGISLFTAVLLVLWFTVIKPRIKSDLAAPEPGPAELVASGIALWQDQKPEEALAQFQRARELDSGYYAAHLGLARVLNEMDRAEDAIPAYKKAIQLDPDEADPYKELGEVYQRTQNQDQALSSYRDFLSRSQIGPEYDRIQGIVQELESALDTPTDRLEEGGKESEEESSLDTTGEKVPVRDLQAERQQKIRHNLTQSRNKYESGRFEESMEFARRVLRLDPENSEARELLRLSRVSLDSAVINALITDYRQALEQARLAAFYQANCAPQLFDEIKRDAELITTLYTDFKAQISGTNIRILDETRAEASFDHQIQGTSKQEGTEQQLFQGKIHWELLKDQDAWKIVSLRFEPLE